MQEVYYIEYLNKEKGFQRDKKIFKGKNAEENAEKWGRKNLDNFNLEMIRKQY